LEGGYKGGLERISNGWLVYSEWRVLRKGNLLFY